MNAIHAPNRCDARAVRFAQVKFVALPMGVEAETDAPAATGAHILRTLLSHIIRVIGRPEAARP